LPYEVLGACSAAPMSALPLKLSRRADVDGVAARVEGRVVALGQDPRVGLAAHGLGAQRARQAEDLLARERLQRRGEGLEHADLDGRVLLVADALALVAVVVHAWLAVGLGEDRRPLAEGDDVGRAQLAELPAHEGVVVGVVVRRDEGAPPVDAAAKALQVALAQRREVAQPVVGVDEGRDVGHLQTHRAQDIPLRERAARLGHDLLGDALLARRRLLAVVLGHEQRERVLACAQRDARW
jgi:hypothetical protein